MHLLSVRVPLTRTYYFHFWDSERLRNSPKVPEHRLKGSRHFNSFLIQVVALQTLFFEESNLTIAIKNKYAYTLDSAILFEGI